MVSRALPGEAWFVASFRRADQRLVALLLLGAATGATWRGIVTRRLAKEQLGVISVKGIRSQVSVTCC